MGLRQKRSREDEREVIAEFEVGIGNYVWVSFGQAVEDLKARNNRRRRSSNSGIHGYMWGRGLCQKPRTVVVPRWHEGLDALRSPPQDKAGCLAAGAAWRDARMPVTVFAQTV